MVCAGGVFVEKSPEPTLCAPFCGGGAAVTGGSMGASTRRLLPGGRWAGGATTTEPEGATLFSDRKSPPVAEVVNGPAGGVAAARAAWALGV